MIPLVLKFILMPFQQTNNQQVRTAVTKAIVHLAKFCVKEFLITEKLNVCWVWLADNFCSGKNQFSQVQSGGLSHHHIIWLYFICLNIALDQRIKKSKTIFLNTDLFLVFYVLKMIPEITYWISRQTVAFIILFSSKDKTFVNSQKLPLVSERDFLCLFCYPSNYQLSSHIAY